MILSASDLAAVLTEMTGVQVPANRAVVVGKALAVFLDKNGQPELATNIALAVQAVVNPSKVSDLVWAEVNRDA